MSDAVAPTIQRVDLENRLVHLQTGESIPITNMFSLYGQPEIVWAIVAGPLPNGGWLVQTDVNLASEPPLQ